jgi:hypothetical protein
MRRTLYEQLDADWRPVARTAVPRRWQAAAPHLDGHRSTGDVIAACRDSDHPRTANRTLAALLHLAAKGDTLAVRAALQACIPLVSSAAASLRRVIGSSPWSSRPELDADAVAALVEIIHRSAGELAELDWPASVLRSRVRDRLRTTLRCWHRQQRRESGPIDSVPHPAASLEHASTVDERMATLVVSAVRSGHITQAAGQTVVATTVYGWDTGSFAAITGRDPRAVRTHRRRTEHRLAELVGAG